MACKILIFLGLGVVAHAALVQVAQPVRVVGSVPLAEVNDYDTVPRYSFAYDVQDATTGDSKAQYETRNGNFVQGSYSLIESDGTRRIVDYTADDVNGFNAVISKEPAVSAPVAVASPAVPVSAVTPVSQFSPVSGFSPIAGVSPVTGFSPIAGFSPVSGVSPVIPVSGVSPVSGENSPGVAASAGPVPTIPSSGPDSDVEVVEARSGRLVGGQSRSSANLVAKSQINGSPVVKAERRQIQGEYVPVRARASAITTPASSSSQRFVTVPEGRRVNYPVYSSYSSPFAFANPSDGLTYTIL
ncbi:cuticle protein 19.8-like [Leptopilina heterotoma]|uniref:cuticle protein 19.8-like n=1 Tax=Leptopilina heterotoma TaxID=63436 RepID=UPI001CA9078F|nr:cuticle protein 19.8-like [Leptopilina heterotoma]